MLVREPLFIPQSPKVIQSACQNNPSDITPQLAVWVVSGIDATEWPPFGTTDLVLSSWRDTFTKSYNSSFNKWARWCEGRDRNPISGPISDVANFLAKLFQEGYQLGLSNYLNSIHYHDSLRLFMNKIVDCPTI